MPTFRLDAYAWIPLPEVPNPIAALPGGVSRWGPGASGPYFGGDNFVMPSPTPSGWSGRTFRAMQSFAFQVGSMGASPMITLNTGVRPGTTTVLSDKRSEGGKVCFSLTATVKTSKASVAWDAAANWYEVKMRGEAQDPVPAAVGALTLGGAGGAAASAVTPNLEWDLAIRFQVGIDIPLMTRARYGVSSGMNMDVSARAFSALAKFGSSGNLVHGLVGVRRFPSYVVYATIDSGSGAAVTIPIYFADASGRNLLEIAVKQTDVLRQFSW